MVFPRQPLVNWVFIALKRDAFVPLVSGRVFFRGPG